MPPALLRMQRPATGRRETECVERAAPMVSEQERIRRGDLVSFKAVFERYYGGVHAFTRGVVDNGFHAEEITQNVFIRLWLKREALDPSRNFKAFLYTLARHEIADYFRSDRYDRRRLRLDLLHDAEHVQEQFAAAYDADASARMLHALLVMPQGVQVMSPDFPGLVQTSQNLGVITAEDDGLRFSLSIRSSVASEKEMLLQKVRAIVTFAGGTVSTRGDYPAWQYARQSPLRDTVMAAYKRVTGKDGVALAIHAGLECGLLAGKMPGLDAVSFGPELLDIHSPRERLGVASVERMYQLVCEILKNCR